MPEVKLTAAAEDVRAAMLSFFKGQRVIAEHPLEHESANSLAHLKKLERFRKETL